MENLFSIELLVKLTIGKVSNLFHQVQKIAKAFVSAQKFLTLYTFYVLFSFNTGKDGDDELTTICARGYDMEGEDFIIICFRISYSSDKEDLSSVGWPEICKLAKAFSFFGIGFVGEI